MAFSSSILLGGICLMFHSQLLGLYTQEAEALQVGLLRLQIMCLPHIFCSLMDAASGTLRGFGRSVTPMLTSILCVCCLRIVWLYTVFAINPTLKTMYISYPITWGLAATVNICCCMYTLTKKEREHDEQ
jgi:Na+-driven multidrug efflux pump